MKKFIIIFSTSALLFSCQKNAELSYRTWQPGQDEKAKNAILMVESTTSGGAVEYKNKSIEFSRQTINGVPVLNSFIKKVSKGSDLELLQAQTVDEKEAALALKNAKTAKKLDYVAEIKKLSPDYSKIEVLSTEDVIVIEQQRPTPYTVVTFFDRLGVPRQSFFNHNGYVRTERTGSQFSDVATTVFSEGPKLSQLSEQVLKNVSAEPSLSNTLIYVTSESDKKISAISSELKFDPKDDRFDQIQVFYYLNKSLQWMRDNLNVRIPQRIDAVVHMGYPQKTNSAFYLQGKIRFGQGDGNIYNNIPHDASIVYHESFHALVDGVARLPFEGEGGSLNEAFADFFTCLMTDRPYLGESAFVQGPYKRSLENNKKLQDRTGGLYHDSLIVSGLLWEIKQKLSSEKARTLAVDTLVKLNGLSKFADFGKALNAASAASLSKDDQLIVQQVLSSRGF